MAGLQQTFQNTTDTLSARMSALGTQGQQQRGVPMTHDPVSLDLGMVRVKFVNGRWVEESTNMMGAAQTVEEENRDLHQRLTKMSSENNMLKYRNEVLMQMLTVARLDLEKYQKVQEDALYSTGGFGGEMYNS
eukprot:TRINITY_DN2468_c0_g2_i1.p2 TRINITY_DN2468_c0_g2~~TRINITY_DN2468_c0_g2_i1.p2  ORF type:complete len:133 (+),score=33.27 TRINITY_DN2468_c0_g2_i1:173-571(+)